MGRAGYLWGLGLLACAVVMATAKGAVVHADDRPQGQLQKKGMQRGPSGMGAAPAEAPEQQRGAGQGFRRQPGGVMDFASVCAITRMPMPNCDIGQAVARGLFETGLKPSFPRNAVCRDIDEGYAISYAHKRSREVFHGGIDVPAPTGTPIVAVAAGTVVGKFGGENGAMRGIEVVLRHAPDDTGLPVWTYTEYGHFAAAPKVELGQRVRMGEVLGPTGNTGIDPFTGEQSTRRRPAIHFGVFYSTSESYSIVREVIVPTDGYWMDPVAFYRKAPPFDSQAMKALPPADKRIPIAVMFDDGSVVPVDTKIVWPYTCARK